MINKRGNILLIILIVTGILAALVRGYFWWTTKISAPLTKTVETKPINETANWKTYSANGYSIKYPSSLKFCVDSYNLIFLNFDNLENDCTPGKDYEHIYERDLVNNHPTYKEGKILFPDGVIKTFYKIMPGNAQRRAYAEVVSDYKKLYLGIYGSDENTFKLFDQILSTFKFLDQKVCEVNKDYQNTAVNPLDCQCPQGYKLITVSMSFGPCPEPKMHDCPATVVKCVKN